MIVLLIIHECPISNKHGKGKIFSNLNECSGKMKSRVFCNSTTMGQVMMFVIVLYCFKREYVRIVL